MNKNLLFLICICIVVTSIVGFVMLFFAYLDYAYPITYSSVELEIYEVS